MTVSTYIDPATDHVLRLAGYRARLEPVSASGRALAEALPVYRRPDENAWRDAIVRAQQVETWIVSQSDTELRAVLSELPRLDPIVAAIDAGRALDESELFATKRLLWVADRVAKIAPRLVDELGWQLEPGWVHELLDAIHPEPMPTNRFRLSSDLDPALAINRRAARKARAESREARRTAEADVVARHGGSFDLRGQYQPETNENGTDELFDDPNLDRIDSAWMLVSSELARCQEREEEAQREVARLESELRERLTTTLRPERDLLVDAHRSLAELDLLVAKVRMRVALDGVWPTIGEGFELVRGWDPGLETTRDIQRIDLRLGDGATVVTGPNMGGKSALLRLVGAVCWLAQHALPVPAGGLRWSFVDRIVYIGSEEPLVGEEGLSSFGREVRRLVETYRSPVHTLWLLDEFGRGTHPDDGAELATEVMEALVERGDTVLMATHFPALAAHDDARHLRIRGLIGADDLRSALGSARDDSELLEALQLAMDYRPQIVGSDEVPRDARLVARALGWGEGKEES